MPTIKKCPPKWPGSSTRRSTVLLRAGLVLLLIASQGGAAKSSKRPKEESFTPSLRAVLWSDRGSIAGLNCYYGAGGREHAPDPRVAYTFIKEDLNGSSPKFDIKDPNGVVWRVKLGEESQPETAATRIIWAAGYFTDEDYFLSEIKVTGVRGLRRGRKLVAPSGIVQHVRLKRRLNVEKLGNWDWFYNQFLGTREFNGLRIMMALINNWDLKAVNNEIWDAGGQQRFVVSDLGASFGKTGGPLSRSKGRLKDFAESPFIREETPEYVDFVLHSRPPFFAAVKIRNYRMRSKMEQLAKGIPRDDAKWLGQRLALLSDNQLRDCFRSAGYSPQEVNGYAAVVKKRIAELNSM